MSDRRRLRLFTRALSLSDLSRTIPPPKLAGGVVRAPVPEIGRPSTAPNLSIQHFPEKSMIDYELKRCTRHCAVTERQLQPGETFFSTLTAEGAELARRDYSVEASACWGGGSRKCPSATLASSSSRRTT